MKKPSVVLIGDVCIDHNSIEGREYTSWGSGTLYMGTYCSSMFGGMADVITSYGADLAEHLPAGIRLLPLTPGASRTMVNGNIVVDGRRTQYSHHVDKVVLPEPDEDIRRSLAGADIVVATILTPLFTPAYLKKLLDLAPAGATKILCPQGYFRDIQADGSYQPRPFHEAAELLPLFDMVSLSVEDYPDVIAAAMLWSNHAPETPIIITEAERGAVVVHRLKVLDVPTNPIAIADIIDPTGAGDVFAMSTVLAYAEHHDVVRAVKSGHTSARAKLLGT